LGELATLISKDSELRPWKFSCAAWGLSP